MTEISIRQAIPDDVDQLADLAHGLNLYHQDDTRPDPALLRQHFDLFEAYVTEAPGGALVGFVAGYSTFQFHTATPGFEVQNIAVGKAHRRAGVGRGLMQTVIMAKYREGVRKFTLGVENTNTSARAFYQSLGFIERDFGESRRCYLRSSLFHFFCIISGVSGLLRIMPTTKSQLRAEMKSRRAEMSGREIIAATEAIQDALRGIDRLCEAKTVFTYLSSEVEPGTYTLIQELWQNGKRVCVPRIDADNRIQPHMISSLDELQPGGPDQFNLRVPPADAPIETNPEITIVPGLAFTRTGQRLGMGGGYYDRFLNDHPDTFAIGLCYDWQLVDALPTEPHDQRVQALVTESGVVRCV